MKCQWCGAVAQVPSEVPTVCLSQNGLGGTGPQLGPGLSWALASAPTKCKASPKARSSCPGPCPAAFWKSPRMRIEIRQVPPYLSLLQAGQVHFSQLLLTRPAAAPSPLSGK